VEAAEQWERALAFVFPERSALEKRLAELRVRIAKEQRRRSKSSALPSAAPAAKPDDDEDESDAPPVPPAMSVPRGRAHPGPVGWGYAGPDGRGSAPSACSGAL